VSRITGGETSTKVFFPPDLLVVVAAFVLTTCAVFVPPLARTVIRPALGLVFVGFVPGYVAVAILFPEHHPEESTVAAGSGPRGLGWIARIVFSFGSSLAIVTLVGLALGATSAGIGPGTLWAVLTVLLVLGVPLAVYRRWGVPPERRVGGSVRRRLGRGVDGAVSPESSGEAVLNVVLVVGLVISSGAIVHAGTPQNGEITGFALLSEDDGEFVASEYPSTLRRGEPRAFSVRINNQEGERVTYTVVVVLREFGPDGDTAVATSELDRFRETVDDNETWRLDHTVVPDRTGDDLQLQYLLYRGEAPARPSVDGAYRELHIWVDVTERNGTDRRRSVLADAPVAGCYSSGYAHGPEVRARDTRRSEDR
jgi:uncharacterized membrane protein